MKTATARPPATAATLPARIESDPSSGPIVRSSRKVILAGSAPARSSTARLVELSTVKLPVMMPEPPPICDWITGAEITLLSSTMAKGWPMWPAV